MGPMARAPIVTRGFFRPALPRRRRSRRRLARRRHGRKWRRLGFWRRFARSFVRWSRNACHVPPLLWCTP